MAARAQPLTLKAWPGAVALGLVVAMTLGPLLAVALRAEGDGARLGPGDLAAIRFTLMQAAISAALATVLAVPVARALARRSFPGRQFLVTLTGAPFLLPVIVAVLGLLAVFGRAGWINTGLAAIRAGQVDIYGLVGIVLAHVFMNLPLAVRLILQGWQAVPSERVRLATALGFGAADMRRHFERPILRATLPGVALLIFLICTTSFATALILGGGPSSTTVELAIYQAFRFEFDLGRAALLGLIQVAICLGAGALAFGAIRTQEMGVGLDRPPLPWPGDRRGARILDAVAIGGITIFLVTPLLAVVLEGLPALGGLPVSVWEAALRSIVLAVASAALAAVLAVVIAQMVVRSGRAGLVESLAFLTIAVSPLVIGTGLFLILRPVADPVALALPVTGAINALVALPFILRALVPAMAAAEATQGRLAAALGLTGVNRFRHAILPRLLRPLGFGTGLAAAFSMGDLGVIALFSTPGQGTLPLEMYRLMGSYRTDDAQGAAVLLMALTLAMFWSFDRGGRMHAAT